MCSVPEMSGCMHPACTKGRRPSFDRAASPDAAEPLYEAFCGFLRELGVQVETGRFRAEMTVDVSGDGPVTFVLDEPFM